MEGMLWHRQPKLRTQRLDTINTLVKSDLSITSDDDGKLPQALCEWKLFVQLSWNRGDPAVQ